MAGWRRLCGGPANMTVGGAVVDIHRIIGHYGSSPTLTTDRTRGRPWCWAWMCRLVGVANSVARSQTECSLCHPEEAERSRTATNVTSHQCRPNESIWRSSWCVIQSSRGIPSSSSSALCISHWNTSTQLPQICSFLLSLFTKVTPQF